MGLMANRPEKTTPCDTNNTFWVIYRLLNYIVRKKIRKQLEVFFRKGEYWTFKSRSSIETI